MGRAFHPFRFTSRQVDESLASVEIQYEKKRTPSQMSNKGYKVSSRGYQDFLQDPPSGGIQQKRVEERQREGEEKRRRRFSSRKAARPSGFNLVFNLEAKDSKMLPCTVNVRSLFMTP